MGLFLERRSGVKNSPKCYKSENLEAITLEACCMELCFLLQVIRLFKKPELIFSSKYTGITSSRLCADDSFCGFFLAFVACLLFPLKPFYSRYISLMYVSILDRYFQSFVFTVSSYEALLQLFEMYML